MQCNPVLKIDPLNTGISYKYVCGGRNYICIDTTCNFGLVSLSR